MRVIVCGGRDFCDQDWLFDALDRIHARRPITFLRQGGQVKQHPEDANLPAARRRRIGADHMAKRWAMSRLIDHDTVNADWKRLGAAAGPIRNGMMIRENDIDAVIAFPGGDGTADMVTKARAAGIHVFEMVRPADRDEIKVGPPPASAAPRAIQLETVTSVDEKRLAEAVLPTTTRGQLNLL